MVLEVVLVDRQALMVILTVSSIIDSARKTLYIDLMMLVSMTLHHLVTVSKIA